MNKLFIVLLAVCLVSVNAFVKRDAPAEEQKPTGLDDLKKKLDELTPKFKEIGDEISETLKNVFDSEKIQKAVQDAASTVNKAVEDAKAKFGGADAGETKA